MSLKNNALQFLVIVFICVSITSCNKDGIQAENSIKGNWNITEINSLYGEFTPNGFNNISTVTEEGKLGSFNFDEENVEYSFTRNDTIYSGNKSWQLESEKENSGFTKVNVFTLTIEDEFIFDVTFDDGTKNSEKNAQNATFLSESPSSGYGVVIELSLEKD